MFSPEYLFDEELAGPGVRLLLRPAGWVHRLLYVSKLHRCFLCMHNKLSQETYIQSYIDKIERLCILTYIQNFVETVTGTAVMEHSSLLSSSS